MARYGVNITPGVAEEILQEAPPEKKSQVASRSAILVTAYAIAVAVTPEFNFFGIPKVRITDLLIPLMLLSFGSGTNAPKSSNGNKSGFSSLCYLLLFWNLGALFIWGEAPPTPGVFYIAKRAIYFLVASLCSASVTSVAAWNQVVRILVFVSPILNFSVLLETFVYQGRGGDAESMRASGIIANQETSTALFIVCVCSLSLGAWDAYKDSFWRIGTVLSLVSGAAAIFATGSRGGMTCIALTLVISVLMRPGKALVFCLLGGMVGVLAWSVTPAPLQARLLGIFPETQATMAGLVDDQYMPDSGSSSIAGRAATAQTFFREYMPRSGMLGMGAGWRKLGAIDNFYLSEWLYHGFLGLCLFLRLLYVAIYYCLATARSARDPVERGVASGVATAAIVMAASGFHADTFYLIRPMECLALLFGLVFARRNLRT